MSTSLHDKLSHLTTEAGNMVHTVTSKAAAAVAPTPAITVGQYLSRYLAHINANTMFVLPGDYNLVLLDELLKPVTLHDGSEHTINMVCCTNELNTGYSADGYARVHGIGAMVVTHSVGSLSCINAIAGAYAEHSPVICITGGLNSNSITDGEIAHHSLTDTHLPQYDYVRRMYEQVTVCAVTITRASDAPQLIHQAISAALRHSRPVLIDVACNVAALPISSIQSSRPIALPSVQHMRHVATDPDSLSAAVEHMIGVLNKAKSTVLVTGQHLRPHTMWTNSPTKNAVIDLINLLDTAFVTLLDGKTMLNEADKHYLGVYSADSSVEPGQAGSGDASGGNAINALVKEVDLVVYIGCVLSDYSTAGHTLRQDVQHTVYIDRESLSIEGQVYHEIQLYDFIVALVQQGTGKLKPNDTALKRFTELKSKASKVYEHISGSVKEEAEMKAKRFPLNLDATAAITTNTLNHKLQHVINTQTAVPLHVITETGDAWFSAMKLKLPYPHTMDIQMQYGSIGWSVGCVNGAAHADSGKKRVVGLIGDGSFQLTAQEVSTMVRYEQNPVIVLLNNHDYVIEEEIHPGAYNRINNWKYSQLMSVFDNGVFGVGLKKKPVAYNVATVAELTTALEETFSVHTDKCVMIEVQLDPKDSNVELGIWANPISKNNARKPGQHVDVKSTH